MQSVLSLHVYTAAELAEITAGRLHCFGCDGSVEFNAVTTDSRTVVSGALFAAISGERTDGTVYIAAAAAAGAGCALSTRLPEKLPERCAVVVVPDVVAAIGALAADYAKYSQAKTIAVTGSVGKTTTKEFISAVLEQRFALHKSEGNHNNEIGMPMTMLATPENTQARVFEMGMCGFGEIDYLSKIARPDIAVITTIGSSHLEQLGTRENICRAKLEITHGMKDDGILICNADEPLLFRDTPDGRHPLFVAIRNPHADYRAVNIRPGVGKTVFDLIYDHRVVTNVTIPTMGNHHVYAALFAYAVGVSCGLNDNEIRQGLLSFKNADMRQSIYTLGGVTVIEDCYNASPESMRAAIDVLSALSAQQPGARTFALLGDMRELGQDSVLLHNQLGITVAQHKLDYLFTLGEIAEEIARGAIRHGMRADRVYANPDCDRYAYSAEQLLELLSPGDILLVKASRAVAAERVIAHLRQHADRLAPRN
ncbi:MAG: UDP-N-acetylmuramoyl-tripeptide--D-alanyl-D-alanine ligase [Clostridia bacterium]|nr:UDP-N-acetylmuramoyl-tripeptide--D-alanyl-D-alanine ligase [Clostridia bacterium]